MLWSKRNIVRLLEMLITDMMRILQTAQTEQFMTCVLSRYRKYHKCLKTDKGKKPTNNVQCT